MYKTILATALLALSINGIAQTPCFGPGPCGEPVEPTGPAELCLPEGCNPVIYSRLNGFALAESILPSGYPVIGWSGPCFDECPDLLNQAFTDLELNAKRANRAMRFGE